MIKKIIKKALVSVSDKSHLKVLADFLYRNKIEVLSTGGTAKELKMLNPKIKLTEIHVGENKLGAIGKTKLAFIGNFLGHPYGKHC